jgi:hypothetical protein
MQIAMTSPAAIEFEISTSNGRSRPISFIAHACDGEAMNVIGELPAIGERSM